MPLPSPSGKESKSKFISRCMSNSHIQEKFSGQKQRLGVCYTQWRRAKGGKKHG